ncbi:MAG TPA: redoxin family protein [Gemmataceae bacterium]|nr:redoxin family protein [Gemmataceae bacterium]
MLRRVLAAGLVLSLAATARAEGPLSVGDPAPKLQVQEFVKGDPVKGLEKGQLYVVEFWATWCSPCRQSIPHLTELAKKHKDVTFIGVSVSEQDFDNVKPFVEKMGDKMDYRVAIDSVPKGKKADEGAMNKTWMSAAEQDGIPTAFVIDKDGKIAWIGHPMEMEKPLAEIAAGKWDLKAAAVAYKEEKAREKKMQTIAEKVQKAARSHDMKGVLAVVDEAIKDDPKMEENLGRLKFHALAEIDADKAADYGRKLINGPFKADPAQLNELAWSVVDPKVVAETKPAKKVAQVAVDAAAKAVELTEHKDPSLLDTLAAAHFAAGAVDKAIDVQQKAVKLKPDDEELKEHLATFKKAKEKGEK